MISRQLNSTLRAQASFALPVVDRRQRSLQLRRDSSRLRQNKTSAAPASRHLKERAPWIF
jgi:hypothetical protein